MFQNLPARFQPILPPLWTQWTQDAPLPPRCALRATLLHDGKRNVDLENIRRILVLGAGKAGAPMAQAVEAGAWRDAWTRGVLLSRRVTARRRGASSFLKRDTPYLRRQGLDAGAELLALARKRGKATW